MAAATVKIIRYVKIRSAVNPYDPEWELYLEARWGWQLAQTQTGRSRIEFLWKVQEGRCVVCGQPLRIAEEDCHIHHRIWRSRRRSGHGGQLGVVACQLSSADPRARRTDESSRVPRGAFVKA